MPCRIAAAASSLDTPSGSATAASSDTSTRSAYEPGALLHTTRSPSPKCVTPSPTALTVPAPSTPAGCGVSETCVPLPSRS